MTHEAEEQLEPALEDALWSDMAALGEAGALDEGDLARAESTLASWSESTSSGRRARWWVAGGVAVVAAAAAVALWVGIGPDATFGAQVSEGQFSLADDQLAEGAELPQGQWVRATSDACVTAAGRRTCVKRGDAIRLDGDQLEVRLAPQEPEAGDADEPPEIAAAPAQNEGEIEIEDEVDTDAARDRVRKPKLDDRPAGAMLAEARRLANSGDLKAAVSAYRSLRRSHPGTPEAHAANVSLGQLQLRRGKARDALRAFDRYIKRGGPLAEEARWGRVQALDKLGRTKARDKAIDALLAAHPRSVYSRKATAMRE